MRPPRPLFALSVALAALAAGGSGWALEPATSENPLLEGIEYRLVGPSRGGRSTTVTGVPGAAHTFYMGTTGGGVWKTQNAGATWENVTDEALGVGSVGAVAVAPSDVNVVYVGTGSGCPRGNISIGDGMYRSTDAGRTWTHLGLERAGLIPRVVVSPKDPDTLWVAVLGQIFGPSVERGVYRSTDGGATFEPVLQVSERTGAVDLAIDPTNPRILYAAMWTAERKPWTLIDGGEESGLYKSTDGGDSWTQLTAGLPDGAVGRIGVSVSAAAPDRVFALVTATEGRGGLFRSDDAGESFRRVSDDGELQTRGWYYSHVHASPTDPNVVWVSNAGFFKSIDGGENFTRVRTPHGDHHDLWINPTRPEIMVQANDGGGTVTLDGGKTWSTQNNQPTAEFYRVSVDTRYPYRLYGAQQDNSTISVPSRPLPSLTPTQQWFSVAGAESGHIAVHPENPDLVFAGNYLGRIDRFDRKTGHSRNMILYPQMQDGTAPRDLHYRFQWNAPILLSKHDPQVLYHASNYVHLSRDGGFTWRTSPIDLTRDDPEKQELPGGPIQFDHTGVEVYNTVFALAEGREPGTVWAGSDGGLVHLSRDWAETWSDVTPSDMPLDSTVNAIDASVHDPGRAYLAVHRYRMDDFEPYVWVTENYGRSWRQLAGGDTSPLQGHPVRVVREDPVDPDLLFAGTEFGMFWSQDRGRTWESFQLNLPRTPITDMTIHRGDLVVATQGRSFWVLDDLEHVRQVAGERRRPDRSRLFEPARTVRAHDGGRRSGSRAVIRFWLSDDAAEAADATLEIVGPGGETLRRFEAVGPKAEVKRPSHEVTWTMQVESGLNEVEWDLTAPGPKLVEGAVMSLSYTGGRPVAPGRFTVRLEAGGDRFEETLVVLKDPRLTDVRDEDLEQQARLMAQVAEGLTEIHAAIGELRTVRTQSRGLLESLDDAGLDEAAQDALEEQLEALVDRTTAAEETLIQTKNRASQDPINFPPKIDNQFAYLYTHLLGDYGAPTEGSRQRLRDLEEEVAPLLEQARAALAEPLDDLNRALAEAGLAGVRRF